MSVLNSEEQELFDTAKKSLPRLLFQLATNPQELYAAFAKLFKRAKDQVKDWVLKAFIVTSAGAFLDQHAKDRGTRRRDGETDAALKARLRSVEDLITKPALVAAANTILAANGLPEDAEIVELRKDGAYLTTFDAIIHCVSAAEILDGETFTIDDGGGPVIYEFDKNGTVGGGNVQVDIAGLVTAAEVAVAVQGALTGALTSQINPVNDIEVAIRKSPANERGIVVTEAVADADFTATTGRKASYCSRGYRAFRRVNEIVVILPFGTTASIASQVAEAMRQKKGAGIVVYVEVRANP